MWNTVTEYAKQHPVWTVAGCVAVLLIAVGVYDVIQKRHAIIHNYPIVGRLRYLLEMIGPELRQYWVANDKEERPFNRQERSWIYASSKGENNTFGFGTSEDLQDLGYPIIKHAAFPFPSSKAQHMHGDESHLPCLKTMGEFHQRRRPFQPGSIINIAAMSYGSLGDRAIMALNKGALEAGCFHNTGEGGVSTYHECGADLIWQLGTGYFGARDDQGRFSIDEMIRQTDETPAVRAIEIKLSQGAKPGKGGILPASKITPAVAQARGIPVGKDCLSPNAHSQFDTVDELITFIETIASATGLPVGIKSAVGISAFWDELATRMKVRGEGPDFISIDGGEGGTGAAPLTFADHVALPFSIGFKRVYPYFQAEGLSQHLVWIGSGKLGFPDRAIITFASGCDLIQVAREAMLSIGCIQAQKCHTGHCPAGVATQNRWLQNGLDVDEKSHRVALYMKNFRKEVLALSYACGYQHPSQFTGKEIEFCTGVQQFTQLQEVLGYQSDQPDDLRETRTINA